MTRLAYLARPIDLATLSVFHSKWLIDAAVALGEQGWATYNPADAFRMPADAVPNPSVSQVNSAAMDQCDALVALFPELPSIGVGMELQRAQSLGMPVLIVTTAETAARSWSLAGLFSARMVVVSPHDANLRSVEATALTDAVTGLGRAAALYDQSRRTSSGTLQVRYDHPDALLPDRSYPGDAGYDLYTSREVVVEPGGFTDVPCGISVQLPSGCWGFITGRSSTLRKHNLLVSNGIIDNGYRGQLYAGVRNLGDQPFRVKVGTRLAQLIPLPLMADQMVPVLVTQLDPSERGQSGFGSSGE